MGPWFEPKPFETEQAYARLGARFLKRYVPTGGDLAMRLARHRYPQLKLVGPGDVEALRRLERGTRIAEAFHLASFVAFSGLAVWRFLHGALTRRALWRALAASVGLGLWPVVLQRYNRLRLYRAIGNASRARSARNAVDIGLNRADVTARACGCPEGQGANGPGREVE